MFLRPCCTRTAIPLSWLSRSTAAAMPLKAKILDPAFSRSASSMSRRASIPKEEPGDDPDDVLFNTIYGVRTIELNRPKKLNSLNGSMARKIIPRLKVLQEWEKSQLASIIIISGAGPKAFCAGGDVAALAQWNTTGPSGQQRSKDYFGLEYQLDHLIATYPKPYIAYMDGITMGGGVGLGVHAPIRIATERTVFAMPETTIGFFPDVGASFFMPRLDGEVGTYLALTSERLTGVNAYYAGVATHYIDSSSLGDLTARLAELVFKDYATLGERLAFVDRTIEEFGTGLPHDEPMVLAGERRRAIDRCFRYGTVEEICAALGREKGEMREWAERTLEMIGEKSPTSLKVALRQMRIGKSWSISETFQREYHVAERFMAHPDFVNGVTAKLIEKPPVKAVWDPPSLEKVSNEDVDRFFDTVGENRLPLFTDGDYLHYPFGYLGLPTEDAVRQVVVQGNVRGRDVLNHFAKQRYEKPGLVEKLEDILARMCSTDGEGVLTWIGRGR